MSDALGARRHWLIWVAAAPLALWAVVRAFGLEGGTYLAPLMAFTPWAGIAALIVACVAAALRNWAAALLAAAATVAIAVAVLPRAFGSAESAPIGSEQLTILSANMAFGGTYPSDLLALVRRQKPDLLAIQELKPEYARNLQEQGILRLLPHSIISVRHRTPGLGIYSSLPIRRLPGFGLTTSRVALTLPDGEKLRIVDVHSPTPGFGETNRWRDTLEGLPSAGAGIPWLLVGDFNATLDQTALREVVDRGYRDAGATTGSGLRFTWPAEKLLPPLITIDHVLADRRLGISDYGVDDLPGSDHHAIHATVFTTRSPSEP